jgi:hypothetical protein
MSGTVTSARMYRLFIDCAAIKISVIHISSDDCWIYKISELCLLSDNLKERERKDVESPTQLGLFSRAKLSHPSHHTRAMLKGNTHYCLCVSACLFHFGCRCQHCRPTFTDVHETWCKQ